MKRGLGVVEGRGFGEVEVRFEGGEEVSRVLGVLKRSLGRSRGGGVGRGKKSLGEWRWGLVEVEVGHREVVEVEVGHREV